MSSNDSHAIAALVSRFAEEGVLCGSWQAFVCPVEAVSAASPLPPHLNANQ